MRAHGGVQRWQLPRSGLVGPGPRVRGGPGIRGATMTMSAPVCPVCGSGRGRDRWSVETTSRFRIRSCKGCGLAFAWPRPTEVELAEFYSSSYFERPEGASPLLGYEDYEGQSLAADNALAMWGTLQRWEP